VEGDQALDETKVREVVAVALKYIQSGGTCIGWKMAYRLAQAQNIRQQREAREKLKALQVPCRPDPIRPTRTAADRVVKL